MEPTPTFEIDVKVTPRTSRNELTISATGEWRVKVTAPPVDGQANAAVSEATAKALGLPSRNVEILRGHTSTRKRLRITGLTLNDAMSRLGRPNLFDGSEDSRSNPE
jgi:uncharacterized protein (TIGR00251 family)